MKIFIHEIKKILRPVPLLILAVFTALFGYMFIRSNINNLTTYHETSDQVALAADLIELCGPTWEANEIEDAVATLTARYISEFEEEIRDNPLFIAAGVTDYKSYRALNDKFVYMHLFPSEEEKKDMTAQHFRDIEEEKQRLISGETIYDDANPFDPETDYTLTAEEREMRWVNIVPAIKLRLINGFVSEYERITLYDDDPDGKFLPEVFVLTESAAVQTKIMEIYESGAIKNILPGWAMYMVNGIYFLLALMILAAVAILLAPVITKDNMNGITALQYSSKTGRKTLGVQLAAMLFTAFVVAGIMSATVFGVLIGRVWHKFLGSGLNSFYDIYNFNLFPGNFGQYFLIVFGLILAMSLVAAMFIFLLSKLCKNYISLILGLVPVTGVLIFISYILFKAPFALTNSYSTMGIDVPLFSLTNIPYTEVYAIGLLVAIGLTVSMLLLKKQKRAEI
ncbi:MAG: ABC transporter permease [Clostridiales bacterium]|jgi:ABC-type multidrug transport system fused ATPase/permease subunit|nr:ABC transporter permease [Clostridiales bacterium]